MEHRTSGLPHSIGQYRVRAQLGAGGMATVYLATVEGPGGYIKPVAIKRMKPSLAKTEEFVKLFVTEARTASLLSHPNICQVNELGGGSEDGYYMVMEYLVGVPFSKVLFKQLLDNTAVPLGMLLALSIQACEGMHFAHTLCDATGHCYDIVHRDLSPPNVYMTVNGTAKILDFGISKSTHSVVETATGHIRGKFSYMSPEQLRGRDLDPRSDVFSLAILVLELVCGARLFKRASKLETFQAVTMSPIPRADAINSSVPKMVADVIEIGLAQDRDERFSSARAFGYALSAAAQKHGPLWTSRDIADFAAPMFHTEFTAHRHWLGSAEHAVAASEAMALDTAEDEESTIVEEEFSSTSTDTLPSVVSPVKESE